MESSFIFLFGHVCWAGGFHANNSTPVYRELELLDRDEVHRAGEKVVMGRQTWEDSLSGKNLRITEVKGLFTLWIGLGQMVKQTAVVKKPWLHF